MRFAAFVLSGALALAPALSAQQPLEVAPGLKITNGSVPSALDTVDGKPQLVTVHASAVQMNNHKGSNIAGGLLAGAFYKPKFTTEIEGNTSPTVIHTTAPSFYVLMPSQGDGTSMFAGWAIVRAGVDKDRRLLTTVKFTQLTGNAKRDASQVETKTDAPAQGWVKITPAAPLTPGEYVLMPVMKQANAFSMTVYDFKVDPSAK